MKLYFHYSLYGFSNVYLIGSEETNDAILIDPAEFNENLLRFIENNGYYVKAVLVTHNHQHHIRGIRTLRKIYDAVIYSSNAELNEYPCTVVRDGERFKLCGMDVRVLSVPGHSSDSIAYQIGKIVFTGDSLQAGLIGQTMSKYGNALLKRSINQKILELPDDCIVLPGHGPPSTVGAERLYNAGLQEDTSKTKKSRYDLFL